MNNHDNKVKPAPGSNSNGRGMVEESMTQLQDLQRQASGQSLTLAQCQRLGQGELRRRFFHSVREGNTDQVSLLLKVNASLVSELDDTLFGALHYAVKCNKVQMVSLLLHSGANVNLKGKEGARPLHVAANLNQTEALQELLASRKIRVDAVDDRGQTALHVACRRNHEAAVKILLSHKANAQLKEMDGTSVLHLPSRRNNLELCQILTTEVGLISSKDKHGVTPLMVAAGEGSDELLDHFIGVCQSWRADVARVLNAQDSEGNSTVHFAAKNNKTQAIEMLRENGANINAQNVDLATPMHLAATLGHKETVAKLLELGALPSLADSKGRTPLHCCIIARQVEICDILLEAGAQARAVDADFLTPFHWACRRGLPEVARKLLRADPGGLTLADIHMRTGLHWAVLAGNAELAQLLLARAGDTEEAVNASDFSDRYPVHYAVEMNSMELIKLLLKFGADFHAVDTEGRTATQLAVMLGHDSLVQEICGLGEYMKRQALRHRDLRGMTSLLIAAERGHGLMFQHLLQQGADFTVKDEFGRTALMLSVGNGHFDIASTIIDKGVDVNASDTNRNTALHYACKSTGTDSSSCIQLLLTNGAHLQQNYSGETPVDVAVLSNNEPAVQLLFSDAHWQWVMSYHRDNGSTHMDLLIEHSPQTAMEILNRSMTDSDSDRLDKNFMVVHNFFYLDPGPDDPASQSERYLGLRSMVERGREDMLQHPLCRALLEYKWSFSRYFFACDFLFYAVFLCCVTAFVADQKPLPISEVDSNTGCRNTSDNGRTGERIKLTNHRLILEKSVVIAFLSVRLALELIKLIFKYLKNYENLFFLLLYVVSFVFIFPPDSEPCLDNWICGLFSVILAWCLLIFQFEHLPVTGIYSLMFQKVILSLIKVICIFAFFIVGFALAFNIGFVHQTPFMYPTYSILKTFDMTVGELEFVTYFVSGSSGKMQIALLIVFVIFVIIMPIGLMNLLVGVAVGDIEGISKEASLRLIEIRINLVYELETNLPRYFQRRLHRRILQVYPNRIGSPVKEYMRPYGAHYRKWMKLQANDRAETTSEERLESVEKAIHQLAARLDEVHKAVVR